MPEGSSGFFTKAAREAAIRKRKFIQAERARLRELGQPNLSVTVTRSDQNHKMFQWEHRRYGAIVVRKSDVLFTTDSSARRAGERELVSIPLPERQII